MSNFKKDLKRGAIGEKVIHNLMPHLQKMGRTADFICPITGATYEIKTDFTTTDNFFVERWSDVEKKKDGGPWRSQKENTQYFIFLMMSEGIGYTFSTNHLIQAVEKLENLKVVNVKNVAWITQGVLVPKEALKHIAKQFKFEVT